MAMRLHVPERMFAVEMTKRLIQWWADAQCNAEVAGWLADDFVYDGSIETLDKAGWCRRVENSMGWSGVILLGLVNGEGHTAAFFEGTEGVTGLKYRFAWLVQLRASRVQRVVQTAAIIG